MKWNTVSKKVRSCKVIIYFSKRDNLAPLSDLLHPGMIPVGDGESNSIIDDLPNIEWTLRHLIWQGFTDFSIVSEFELMGLNYLCNQLQQEVNLSISEETLHSLFSNLSSSDYSHFLIIPGQIFTNANFELGIQTHRNLNYSSSLLSIRGLKHSVGIVEFSNLKPHKIKSFREKPIDHSQLISTGILLINKTEIQKIVMSQEYQNMSRSSRKFMDQIINHKIKEKKLYTIELESVNSDIWVHDLSVLENWIKLEASELISKYDHLFTKSSETTSPNQLLNKNTQSK